MVQRAPSNTEPLLRLNAEARSPELLADKTAEVLAVIRGEPSVTSATDEKEPTP